MDREDLQQQYEQGRLISPAVNICETDDAFLIRAQMPGVKKEEVELRD